MQYTKLLASFFLLIFVVTAAPLHGQINPPVTGTIESSDGTPVAGVAIEVATWDGDTIAHVTSDQRGGFVIPNLPDGNYVLSGTYAGQPFRQLVPKSGPMADIIVRVSGTPRQSWFAASPVVSVNDLQAPNKARKQYGKATRALNKHQPMLALRLINDVIAIAPRWGRAYFFRGILLMQFHSYDKAENDLSTAVKQDPSSAALTALGALYTRIGDYRRADLYLDRATVTQPVAWQAYFELARLRYMQKRYRDAIFNARRALDAAPPDAAGDAHFIVAESYLGINDHAAAAPELRKFLAGRPVAVAAAIAQRQLVALTAGVSRPPIGSPAAAGAIAAPAQSATTPDAAALTGTKAASAASAPSGAIAAPTQSGIVPRSTAVPDVTALGGANPPN